MYLKAIQPLMDMLEKQATPPGMKSWKSMINIQRGGVS